MKEKTCGLCGKKFTPLQDGARLICYSSKCEAEYNAAKELENQKKYDGFVYLMKSGKYYKIGKTSEVSSRLKQIKSLFPILKLVHQFACRRCGDVESYLHKKYKEQQVKHEWYKLERQDVEWFMSLQDYSLDNL